MRMVTHREARRQEMSDIDRLALAVQITSLAGTSLEPEFVGLLSEGLGGICLFGSNTAAGHAGVKRLTASIHTVAPAAVVAIDEEGGDVTRLHFRRGSPALGPAALGAVDDLDLTQATGSAIGSELATLGIDVDFAPVADVNSNPANPVIGTRSFGSDPTLVAAHVTAWLTGLQAAGVAACVKHFPGHGDTEQDSHLVLPTVGADRETLDGRELIPFHAAVDAGVAGVMTAHLLVPAIDPALPATLSGAVLSMLRHELRFSGAVVTDALDMAGVSANRGIPEAAVQALLAGADLLCLGADRDAAQVRAVQRAVIAAVDSGRLPQQRLADAAAHAAGLRRSAHPPRAVLDDTAQLAGARRAIVVGGTVPDLTGAVVVRVDTTLSLAVGDVAWGLPADVVLAAHAETDLDEIRDRAPLVIQVRDAHRSPEVGQLVARLAERARTSVVVEWGWPGPYDGGQTRICARGFSRPAAEAVRDVLREAGFTC
jgi:beta-N-acetylhexosaminidase